VRQLVASFHAEHKATVIGAARVLLHDNLNARDRPRCPMAAEQPRRSRKAVGRLALMTQAINPEVVNLTAAARTRDAKPLEIASGVESEHKTTNESRV
jgi:hypothetical protein